MSWLVLSCVPPFIWAFNNVFDEYLAKTAFARAGPLLIFLSGALDFAPAILFFFLFPSVLDVAPAHAALMMCLGFMLTSSFVPYIFALQKGNAGIAVPIYQTIPVFVFILGLVFLGETATPLQIFAGLLIVTAAILVGFDFETRRINKAALLLMLISSLSISVFAVLSKFYILEYDWKTLSFWAWTGSALFSLSTIILLPGWIQKSGTIIKSCSKPVLYLFAAQVAFQISAIGIWYKAVSIGPSVALVQTVGGLQPAFILILAMIFGHFSLTSFPKIAMNKELSFKFVMIAFMMIGVYMLSL